MMCQAFGSAGRIEIMGDMAEAPIVRKDFPDTWLWEAMTNEGYEKLYQLINQIYCRLFQTLLFQTVRMV